MSDALLKTVNFLNFRGLSGLPTRNGRSIAEGRLFRSAAFDSLSKQDAARLDTLSIRQVADLRSPEEQRQHPSPLPAAGIAALPLEGLDVVNEALRGIASGEVRAEELRSAMRATYAEAPISYAPAFGGLLRGVLEGPPGLLIHCAIGKDRTGMAVALLLELAGVPRRAILEDYLTSNAAAPQILKALIARFPARRTPPPEVIAPLIAADPDYLDAFWQRLDQDHGGAQGYLSATLQISPDALPALRAALVS